MDFHRPQYQAMLRKFKIGDLLYALSIGRLGRSYEEMQELWRLLTKKNRGDMQLLDIHNQLLQNDRAMSLH